MLFAETPTFSSDWTSLISGIVSVGFSVLVAWYCINKWIPKLIADFADAAARQREEFIKSSEKERDDFAIVLKDERLSFAAALKDQQLSFSAALKEQRSDFIAALQRERDRNHVSVNGGKP